MIPYPIERQWKEVWYHPQPIITRVRSEHSLDSWKEEIKGCKIEPIEEDLGFMKNLVRGIKVKITYPEDCQEMYVEPLATVHKIFFDELDIVIKDVYPYPTNRRSWQQKRKREIGHELHLLIGRLYWDLDYKKYTPETWTELLNSWLQTVETYSLKTKDDLEVFREYITLWTEGVENYNGL